MCLENFLREHGLFGASLLKKYALRGNNEAEGVTYLFRLLQNLAMPLSMVPVS